MRGVGYEPGRTENFRVVVDDKVYDLFLTGIRYEYRNVAGLGRVRCLKLEPKAKFGEIFVRKGRIMVWVSTRKPHVCVKMSAKVPLASVQAILTGIEGADEEEAE